MWFMFESGSDSYTAFDEGPLSLRPKAMSGQRGRLANVAAVVVQL